MISIDAVVYGLDNCIRGGRLVRHEVVRVLDGLGFPYDPCMGAFSLDNRSVHMDVGERIRYEEARKASELRALRGDAPYDGPSPANANTKVDQYPPTGSVPGISGTGDGGCGVSRMQARDVLRNRAYELRRKAHQLEALAASIPDNFPGDAEAALWDLALSVRTF